MGFTCCSSALCPLHPTILDRFQLLYCIFFSRPKPTHTSLALSWRNPARPSFAPRLNEQSLALCVLIVHRLITALSQSLLLPWRGWKPWTSCTPGPGQKSAAGMGATRSPAVAEDFSTTSAGALFFQHNKHFHMSLSPAGGVGSSDLLSMSPQSGCPCCPPHQHNLLERHLQPFQLSRTLVLSSQHLWWLFSLRRSETWYQWDMVQDHPCHAPL